MKRLLHAHSFAMLSRLVVFYAPLLLFLDRLIDLRTPPLYYGTSSPSCPLHYYVLFAQ